MIHADECGIQEDLLRERGRIGKDKNGHAQRLYGEKTGTKHRKTGLIAGYAKLPDKDQYLYIAPMVYNCNCDTVVFNTWLEKIETAYNTPCLTKKFFCIFVTF